MSYQRTRICIRIFTVIFLASAWGCGRYGFESHTRDNDSGAADLGEMDAALPDLGMDGSADASGDANDASNIDLGPPSPPGIVVSPIDSLITTEMGGSATFTIVLASQPTADVTIALTSSDTGEGTVSPSAVVFTTLNWNAPQTVTVTGVNDTEADGPQDYTVETAAATSDDSDYAGMNSDDVSVTNVDDDTPGVFILPLTDLETTELGASDTFTMRLLAQPTADVTIPLASSNTDEAAVTPDSVTFTPDNWASARTITVTGVDDAIEDGDQPFTIETGLATSSDTSYSMFDGDDVMGVNRDNELAAVVISPLMGITTSESGGSAMFTIVLQAQPSADVMVSVASSDTTEGTVAVANVVFTPSDWSVAQAVTVAGVDDAVADGDQSYQINVGAAVSSDPLYSGKPGGSVSVTNIDNDTPSIVIGPPTSFTTTESGGTRTFSLVLTSQPTASVSISLASTDTTEGTVSPMVRSFSTSNWSTPQIVTVTGVNDVIADGDQSYDVEIRVALSADANYAVLPDERLTFINVDDETPGITVTPTTGLTTSESGGTATFTVVLNSQPTATVSIGLSSDLITEGTVSPASIMFTMFNWSTPQTITVTGVNDIVADGSRVYHIVTAAAVSTDPSYSGMDASDVTVVNADNDSPGIYVSPVSLSAPETGSAVFYVVLGSQPTASVTIPLRIMNTMQGSISPTSLTFTTVNWNTARAVTVTSLEDGLVDGTFVNTVFTDPAVTTDMTYSGLDGPDVTMTHIDRVQVLISPTPGLVTTEAGGTATFDVVLDTAPSAPVSFSLSSSDASEGTPVQTLVTFSTTNWNVAQQVTVTGVNDNTQDGTQSYSIVTGVVSSSDTFYNGINPSDVSVMNTDDDVASITLEAFASTVTSENQTFIPIRVTLGATPTSTSISFTSSDTTEGTVLTTIYNLGLVAPNYSFLIYVTGVDDLIVDGDIAYNIVPHIGGTDPAYNALVVPPVALTNIDNDNGPIVVSRRSGLSVSEGGATATFQVRPIAAPTANVTVAFSSSDTGEGTVSPASVVFTPSNFTARTITITGVADLAADGDQEFSIITAPAVSTDPAYSGVDPDDVNVTNVDQETSRLISATRFHAPAGGSMSYTMSSVSSDNRYVVFVSGAADIVEGDTNGARDVFVRDRLLGTSVRASLSSTGAQLTGAAGSSSGAISANGRYVAFTSYAADVVPSDTNATSDVFVRDLVANTTTLVSRSMSGVPANAQSQLEGISADGRYVLFMTIATNVDAGDTSSGPDLYLFDTMTNTMNRTTVGTGGVDGAVSADGRFVAFTVVGSALPVDTNGMADVYMRDTVMGTLSCISLNSSGVIGNGQSAYAALSADGRYVAFYSSSSNLVVGDDNGLEDIFVRDTLLGTTSLISVSSAGVQANRDVRVRASISNDGRRVAYASTATNLVADDTNGTTDVFVRDRMSNTTVMLSRSPSGDPQNRAGDPAYTGLSPDGTLLVFSSQATNLMSAGFTTGTVNNIFAVPVP